MDELHEAFVSGVVPSQEDQDTVLENLHELLDRTAPDWCRPEMLAYEGRMALATDKVGRHLSDVLIDRGWSVDGEDGMMDMSVAAASLVMSEFTDIMSSETMPPVTSDAAGFRAQSNALLCTIESRVGVTEPMVTTEPESPTLLTDPLRVTGDDEVAIALARLPRLALGERVVGPQDLERLALLRSDAGYDEMRWGYREQVESYLDELRRASAAEILLVHESWEQRLRADRVALKRELTQLGVDLLTEKEGLVAVAVSAAAGAGAVVALGPLGVVLGVGIAGAGVGKRAALRRREILDGHWSSWLFQTQGLRHLLTRWRT